MPRMGRRHGTGSRKAPEAEKSDAGAVSFTENVGVKSQEAGAAHQAPGGGVQPVQAASPVSSTGTMSRAHHLAHFRAPLVERANAPRIDRFRCEHLVLVERHQAAQPAWRQLVQHRGGAGLWLAPVLLERRLVVLVVGQRPAARAPAAATGPGSWPGSARCWRRQPLVLAALLVAVGRHMGARRRWKSQATGWVPMVGSS